MFASPAFDGSDQIGLLRFLHDNRERGLESRDIEIQHYKHKPTGSKFNPAHARERILNLRLRLEKYQSTAKLERLQCSLPLPSHGEGYRLVYGPTEWAGPRAFWLHHLDRPYNLTVITGSHLFFFNREQKTILRFSDMNAIGQNSDSLKAELQSKHPEADLAGFNEWNNAYLASGDVLAHERMARWFYDEANGVLVERRTDQDINEVQLRDKTPIFIGRPQTNRFIRTIQDSPEASHLRYRIQGDGGAISIRDIRPEEKSRLSRYKLSVDGRLTVPPTDNAVIGLVTRMPSPWGRGHVTMIACDYYAMVIARIVESMTSEDHALELLRQMQWPRTAELPSSFEIIFRVALSPGGIKGEGWPEVLCWYPHL